MIVKSQLVIIRYGEISLKSRYVRKKFENILIKNIKKALKKNCIDCKIEKERGRIFLLTDQGNSSLSILKRIFGIISFSMCIKTKSNIEDISKDAIVYAKNNLKKDMSFAVRTNRTGKHNFTSQDVSVKIGSDIVENFKSKVDLTNPDYELFIDIRDNYAYIFDKKIKGPGGMPVGSQDKVISIIDDGFSLLSSLYLISRGCKTVFYVSKKFDFKKLESFCENWFIPKDFLFFNEKDDFYLNINKISNNKCCKAVVSAVYDLKEDKLKIKKFKEKIQNPVLYPLVSMEKELIHEKMKKLWLRI